MTFATQLKQARQAAGLTQCGLAQKLGITPQTLRNWEAGRTEPPVIPDRSQSEILYTLNLIVQES